MVTAVMKLKDTCFLEESYNKLDSMLKSRDITLLTKVHIVKVIVFIVRYGCESWAIMKAGTKELMLCMGGSSHCVLSFLGTQKDKLTRSLNKRRCGNVNGVHWIDYGMEKQEVRAKICWRYWKLSLHYLDIEIIYQTALIITNLSHILHARIGC